MSFLSRFKKNLSRTRAASAASPACAGGSASRRLLDAAGKAAVDLLQEHHSSATGLRASQVEDLRALHGENALTQRRKDSLAKRLFKAFINPFSVVLLLLAVISFVTDFLLASAGERDLTAVLIVSGMVLISGALRFVQESRSGAAVARLESLVGTTIDVLRDGQSKERPIRELVTGDVVRLAAGDKIGRAHV